MIESAGFDDRLTDINTDIGQVVVSCSIAIATGKKRVTPLPEKRRSPEEITGTSEFYAAQEGFGSIWVLLRSHFSLYSYRYR